MAQPLHASKKRKYTPNALSSGKRVSGLAIRPEASEVAADVPRYGVEKGLMTSKGCVALPLLPLLVKDREYAVDITRFVV